ncbi:hypothetical protein [Faecalimicrobium sp. JNUCC 81]
MEGNTNTSKKLTLISLILMIFTSVFGFANVFSAVEPALGGRILDTIFMIAGSVAFSIVALILYSMYESRYLNRK